MKNRTISKVVGSLAGMYFLFNILYVMMFESNPLDAGGHLGETMVHMIVLFLIPYGLLIGINTLYNKLKKK